MSTRRFRVAVSPSAVARARRRARHALFVAILPLLAMPALAEPAPTRTATAQDLQLLDTGNAPVKQELDRIGLHRTVGKVCTAFVTADSIRPLETPLPLDGGTVTLPYASFLIWSADRPFGDAVLYHVYSPVDAPYRQPVSVPPGVTSAKTGYAITLAKREPLPSENEVAQHRAAYRGPFTEGSVKGAIHVLSVRPYTLPTQDDDPASVLPRKAEQVLQVTCLIDAARATNCLCAGTE